MKAIVPCQPTTLPSAPVNDDRVIRLWLSRFSSPGTLESYTRAARTFMEYAGSIWATTPVTLMEFGASLKGKPATRAARLAAVKSLLTFACDLGYTERNAGKILPIVKVDDRLAERILTEPDVLKLINAAPRGSRDHVLLRILYTTGARVSEIAGLRWQDVLSLPDGRGLMIIHGKGDKTRTVIIENPQTFAMLQSLRGKALRPDLPVFVSRKSRAGSGRMDRHSIWLAVQRWAKRAGFTENISPHWMRHAHASHALDHGANVHEVMTTLGHSSLVTTTRYCHARPDHSSGRVLAV